jgi:aminopeptidase N
MKNALGLFAFIFFISFTTKGQELLTEKTNFTHQDTLRGTITPEREWWDLTYYHLDVKILPETKSISGKNTIQYRVLKPYSVMQIDLQEPLKITKVLQNNKELELKHDGNAHFITLVDEQKKGSIQSIDVYYEGIPKEAIRAPWDGGFSWKEDKNGFPFIATSCQGLGASVWWPNKDHMYDEVDSMLISVNVPKNLTNISNGKLRSIEKHNDNTVTSNWFVSNPINNYGVNVNIGDYEHFSEIYEGENGPLEMDYYVLRDNLVRAKNHFKDAPRMMKAFEHWFGPYPFYEDGYKLVEVPYLGMEHQSSVTYGNQYKNGYLGNDLSGTGWGLKFDFIIIHESGHEWFANNITYKDIADMWIHESFTNYSENLFVEYYYGKEAGAEYVIGTRKGIRNDSPIIGSYNVNKEGSGDMYPKGGNILHTLRQLVEDDEKWRQMLRGLNKTFYHQTVTTKQIEDYLSEQSGIDLTAFFNQYLRDTRIPTLEYSIENKELKYRWTNIVANFDMPIQVTIDDNKQWIYPNAEWKMIPIEGETIEVDPNFYVETKKL